jgi:hypothetical protein
MRFCRFPSLSYTTSIILFIDLIIADALSGMESDDESSVSTIVLESVPDCAQLTSRITYLSLLAFVIYLRLRFYGSELRNQRKL